MRDREKEIERERIKNVVVCARERDSERRVD